MEDKNKRVAAISAVMEYLKAEEADPAAVAPSSAAISQVENLWGVSGRQAQMQLRTIMQLKGFHGWRTR